MKIEISVGKFQNICGKRQLILGAVFFTLQPVGNFLTRAPVEG